MIIITIGKYVYNYFALFSRICLIKSWIRKPDA